MQVGSMNLEDPLEEGMATSSILPWRIPLTEEPGGLQSMGSQSWTWLKQPSTNAFKSFTSFTYKDCVSILKKINPEYTLKGLMLKLQYFGHLMWRADSLEKTLILGKIESMRRRGWQRIRWLDDIIDSMDMNLSKLWEIVKDGEARNASVQGVALWDAFWWEELI